MSAYTLSATLNRGYAETVDLVRAGLADQGFGVITEIDMKATLKAKIDVDVAPQIILGACRPALAHQAILADPSVAALLPCNVVVRTVDADTTVVEAFDPSFMAGLARGEALAEVAADAGQRLTAMLAQLNEEN